jgi:hypothetical protein
LASALRLVRRKKAPTMSASAPPRLGDDAKAISEALAETDELVREYLLFRGFARAFHAFAMDAENDSARQFNVDALLMEIERLVRTQSARGLIELWNFLDVRFFSRLDAECASTVARLESSLHRYYLVTATQAGQSDAALYFLQLIAGGHYLGASCRGATHPVDTEDRGSKSDAADGAGASRGGSRVGAEGAASAGGTPRKNEPGSAEAGHNNGETHRSAESKDGVVPGAAPAGPDRRAPSSPSRSEPWSPQRLAAIARRTPDDYLEWFALPFTQQPHTHPCFAPYFNPSWAKLFRTSLRNFLHAIFRAIPLPRLMAFKVGRLERAASEARLRSVQAEARRLRQRLAAAEGELQRTKLRSQSLVEEIGRAVPRGLPGGGDGTSRSPSAEGPEAAVNQEEVDGEGQGRLSMGASPLERGRYRDPRQRALGMGSSMHEMFTDGSGGLEDNP